MKKFLTYLFIVLLVIALYIIQIFVIDKGSLFGLKPNLLLISVVTISLWYGLYAGSIYSLIIGIITDLIFGSNGQFTLCYSITGCIIGFLNYNYRKENKVALLYVISFATLIFETSQYVLYIFTTSSYINLFFLIKHVAIACLLNICIAYIIYGLLYKITEMLDDSIYAKVSYESLR